MRSDIFYSSPNTPVDSMSYPMLFNELHAISGGASEITPEFSLRLGYAAGSLASRIAVGYSDKSICKILANAFIAGAGAGGAQITETDAGFFAVSAFLARTYLFNLTVFFEYDGGRLRIRMTDKYGLPIDRESERRLELLVDKNTLMRRCSSDMIMPKSIMGTQESFALDVSKSNGGISLVLSVDGKSIAAKTLSYVLTACGCEVCNPRRGIISLAISEDGETLLLRDENEQWYDGGHVTALLCLIHFLSGNRELAACTSAPSVLEQIAAEFDGRILRVDRDNGAREIFASQRILTDAISNAVFLCSYLAENKASLSDLFLRIPQFTLISREVSVSGNRLDIISKLSSEDNGVHKENADGLRVCADGGWVNISPARSKNSLQITGEGFNEEIASELCDLYIEKALFIDKGSQN